MSCAIRWSSRIVRAYDRRDRRSGTTKHDESGRLHASDAIADRPHDRLPPRGNEHLPTAASAARARAARGGAGAMPASGSARPSSAWCSPTMRWCSDLNRRWRGKDEPTNVLAFASDEPPARQAGAARRCRARFRDGGARGGGAEQAARRSSASSRRPRRAASSRPRSHARPCRPSAWRRSRPQCSPARRRRSLSHVPEPRPAWLRPIDPPAGDRHERRPLPRLAQWLRQLRGRATARPRPARGAGRDAERGATRTKSRSIRRSGR